jgi:ERCC4-type nuclease
MDIPSPIYIDRRIGSAELYTPLQNRGVPVELTTLEFGDVCFIGYGPETQIVVGVERKRITDLLQSLISGRLSGHQLPGLVESYAYRWLLVEGSYRESPDGFVEIPRGHGKWDVIRLQYTALENYLVTLCLRGGIHVQRTYSVHESAAWLDALHRWWTRKDWADHRSHLALHQSADYAIFLRPTLVHAMAAQLPGIDQKAKDIAVKFKSVADMVAAEEPEWRTIPGIGKTLAARIHKALRTRE